MVFVAPWHLLAAEVSTFGSMARLGFRKLDGCVDGFGLKAALPTLPYVSGGGVGAGANTVTLPSAVIQSATVCPLTAFVNAHSGSADTADAAGPAQTWSPIIEISISRAQLEHLMVGMKLELRIRSAMLRMDRKGPP